MVITKSRQANKWGIIFNIRGIRIKNNIALIVLKNIREEPIVYFIIVVID